MPPAVVRMVSGPMLPSTSAAMPNANACGVPQGNADLPSNRIRQLKEVIQSVAQNSRQQPSKEPTDLCLSHTAYRCFDSVL
jgi:hypothetical protein